MRIPNILTFTLAAALMVGCASNRGNPANNPAAIQSVRSVAIDSPISKAGQMSYSDRLSQNMESLAVGSTGLLSMVIDPIIASKASAAAARGPRAELEQAVQSHSIVIEKIAADAFAAEIQRSGNLTLASPGKAEAAFKLSVGHGIEHPPEDMFHGSLAPVVTIHAQLIKDGAVIYDSFPGLRRGPAAGMGRAPKEYWHSLEEFKSNPELIRTGWQAAAADASKKIIADMTRRAGKR